METKTDGSGQKYIDVGPVRVTYVPADQRPKDKNWTGGDVVRIQAYLDPTGAVTAEGLVMHDTTPQYDIIVRFDLAEDGELHSWLKMTLACSGIEYPEWEGTYELGWKCEHRMRIWIRDEPSSPSGVAVSDLKWEPEESPSAAQLELARLAMQAIN